MKEQTPDYPIFSCLATPLPKNKNKKKTQNSKLHHLFPKCFWPLHLILHMHFKIKVIWKTYIPETVVKRIGYLQGCLHTLKIAADNVIQHFCPVLKKQKWQARWVTIKKVQLDSTFYFVGKTKSKSYIQILGTIITASGHCPLEFDSTLNSPCIKGLPRKPRDLKG